ncbi:MAG: nicotinate (nicotinamide) nucleotide adenylyltransferase [Agarilytica sp.]
MIATPDALTALPVEILFGGSFDPVHIGHQAVVQAAMNAFESAHCRILPCKIPPHKQQLQAKENHRLAMLRLAFEGYEGVTIDPLELESSETSYTLNTVKRLREQQGESLSMCFVLGEDSWLQFTSWYQWQEILKYVNLLVVSRPPVNEAENPSVLPEAQEAYRADNQIELAQIKFHKCGKIAQLPMHAVDAASTNIRRSLSEAKHSQTEISAWVPAKVAHYISEFKLYH